MKLLDLDKTGKHLCFLIYKNARIVFIYKKNNYGVMKKTERGIGWKHVLNVFLLERVVSINDYSSLCNVIC